MMMIREKKDINPLLLKFGVALAISLAGFLYSRVRARMIKLSSPPPSPRSSDNGSEVNLEGGRARHNIDLHAISTSSNPVSVAAEKSEETCMPKASIDCRVKHSPSSKITGDKDGFLLPEFEDLVKEFDSAAANAGFSPKKEDETPRPRSNIETPKAFRSAEKDQYEHEIRHLRNTVRVLQERERILEVQLLEYYGLKEQETAVMEIQNRLKLNNMEAKLFTLKIESLRADNQRLAAQVADHVNVVAELEAARAKIKLLKKKLCSEAEQNREQILALQGRVAKLHDQEYKADPSDPKIQLKLQRLKDMEVEAEELRKSNMRLQVENTELSRRLESTQILANSVLEDPEAEAFRVEEENLRHKNKDLEEEIERLQAYRCSDAEELVYLKWINACLRYELRNYQPRDGKTVARDLSKTLSPKSEGKAKQLILEYANTEGVGEKGLHFMDFDYEDWSYSHASILTDSGELDDTSVDNSSATKTISSIKTKLFSKLGRIIRGKDSHDNHVLSVEKSGSLECGDSPRCSSNISRGTYAGTEGHVSRLVTPQDSSRPSLDLHRFWSLREESIKDIDSVQKYSDLGSSSGYKRFGLGRESADLAVTPKTQLDGDSDATEKSELVKYAEALKDSHGGLPKFRRRSASFC